MSNNNVTDDNILKYIGYSMRKQQWVIIPKDKKRDDTYEFFEAGASAFTYVNPSTNKLVKIIHGPRYDTDDNYVDFIKECEKEIENQQRASENGLAPHIYINQSGFVPKENSFYSKNETPYFYIIMEYLSKKKGWERTFIGDKPDSIFCNYIEKFVSKTGLINIKDPQAHFYYNDKKDKDNLYMIDYGNCEECGIRSVSKCIDLMASVLGIKCATKKTKGGYHYKKQKRTKRTKHTKRTKRRTLNKYKCKY